MWLHIGTLPLNFLVKAKKMMNENIFHNRQVNPESDTYYIPSVIAERLCLRIRNDIAWQLQTKQWWACKRCMVLAKDGVPLGLQTPERSQYHCEVIARRYGYELD